MPALRGEPRFLFLLAVAGPEDRAKDVAKLLKNVAHVAVLMVVSSALHSRMSELIVFLTLLIVRENLVGLGRLFEFIFCLLVVGIPVGMVLEREFSV